MQHDTRPLGAPVPDWTPPPRPADLSLTHPFVTIEPLSADRHAAQLFKAYSGHDGLWHYLYDGPFHSASQFHKWVKDLTQQPDTCFVAFRADAASAPFGMASYLRIAPDAGSIEVGNICIAPHGQRSRAFTAAMYLMMQWAFDAGYRRYEWKCNALNLPSRRAAQRLGFSFEGVFRPAAIAKGRTRDTAWFSVIDSEWPALKTAFDTWLSPSNFDPDGTQTERLSDLTRLVRASSDPALQGSN